MKASEKTSFLKSLKDIDKKVLLNIYIYRCLDRELLFEYFYKNEGKTENYVEYKTRQFFKFGLIDIVRYAPHKRALFLTTEGVRCITVLTKIPESFYPHNKKRTVLGLYSAAELKIDPRAIAHQLELNKFALFAEKNCFFKYGSLFYNDKFCLGKYNEAHPDGILSVSDLDAFLEMDMGTESVIRLRSKWNTYLHFFKSNSYVSREADVVVLFILNMEHNTAHRRRVVLSTLHDSIWNNIGNGIEFYIGNTKEIESSINRNIIPKYIDKNYDVLNIMDMLAGTGGHGFTLYKGSDVKSLVNDESFDIYMCKHTPNKKGVLLDNGVPQEYFVDSYLGAPVSVLKRISYFARNDAEYKGNTGRDFKMVVVLEDGDHSIFEDLKAVRSNPASIDRLYFTTRERLETMTFKESLFRYNILGEPIFEG